MHIGEPLFTGGVRPARGAFGRGRESSPARFVMLVVLASILLRLTYIGQPLRPDEAGYLLVAESWHHNGPNLYGGYWVDRPPLLIALFKLASLVDWPPAVRLVALPFVALMVVSAAWAAHQVAGPRGARWAALVGAALLTTPALASQAADGEIFAAPLVMLSVALTIKAARSDGAARAGVALLAGLAAGAAVMVKQNFADGVVFAIVLVVASTVQGAMRRRKALTILSWGAVGVVTPVAAALAWARWASVGATELWFDVFGFRWAAFDVIEDHNLIRPLERAAVLVAAATLAGLIPMAVVVTRSAWRARFHGSPLSWAIGVTALYGVAGIAGGGNYWAHYLQQLAPMAALATGLWAVHIASLRRIAVLTVASALASTMFFLLVGAVSSHNAQRLGDWLRDSGRAGDTMTVLYGHADVQQAAGMTSPYEHLWSLPMRTLDPDLAELRRVLGGPDAPTWVVGWSDLNSWEIDSDDRLRDELAAHYRLAGTVCGTPVWLHTGVRRELATAPQC